jgi:lysophospholipase L1-like esterase
MPSTPSRHVVCLGDSITRGQASVDYIKILAHRTAGGPFVFTNAGVNGDLAFNALQRLDSVIDLQPDVVTVLIGTNDAIASLSERNIRRYTRMKKLSTRPTIEWYRENLTVIVQRLAKETCARIGLLSLPVLGEQLGSESVRRSAQYSAVVKEIAETRSSAYLPLNEQQTMHLKAIGFTRGIQLQDSLAQPVSAVAQHFLLRRSFDDISRRRDLELTTDLIHQNTRGATMIADLIGEFISR